MEDAKTQNDGIDDHMDNPVIKAEAADGLKLKIIKNWSMLPIHLIVNSLHSIVDTFSVKSYL